MIKLVIDEEYGFRIWYAELTQEEYQNLLARWETMRGLNCLVPVKLIIPQAIEIEIDDVIALEEKTHYCCHIHECDDSRLEGSSYKIPEDENFWMDGRKYEREEYWPDETPIK